MSIQIEASYAKKCGLPHFSSHSFMVTVRAEISSLRRLETESTRLYLLLQESVDKQMQQVGFLPDPTKYGMILDTPKQSNRSTLTPPPSDSDSPGTDTWGCSDKQRAFIEKVAKRERFTPADLDGIARTLCQLPVQQLDKRQASKLIDELLNLSGPPRFTKRATPRDKAAVNGTAA